MEKFPGVESNEKEEKAEAIRNAQTFEEFYDAIRNYGPVQGSKGEVQPEDLIAKIETSRMAPIMLEQVTNGGDLRIREKVKELINKELPQY